jgi:hypothetical protein
MPMRRITLAGRRLLSRPERPRRRGTAASRRRRRQVPKEVITAEIISFYHLRWHVPKVMEFINACRDERRRMKPNTIKVHIPFGSEWPSLIMRTMGTEETLILSKKVITIVNDVGKFCNSRLTYMRRGQLYRRAYLLYGPPGTGKSTPAHVTCCRSGPIATRRRSATSVDLSTYSWATICLPAAAIGGRPRSTS